MKKLFIGLLILGSISSAYSLEKILECSAKAAENGKIIFEIQTDVHNIAVDSQGTTISDYTKMKAVITELKISSNDKFKDNFSISIRHTVGENVIENESLNNLSLKAIVKEFGISKNLDGYETDLTCIKL